MNILNIHRKFWKILLLLALLVSGEEKMWGYVANENYSALSSAAMKKLTATERTVEIPLSDFMGMA